MLSWSSNKPHQSLSQPSSDTFRDAKFSAQTLTLLPSTPTETTIESALQQQKWQQPAVAEAEGEEHAFFETPTKVQTTAPKLSLTHVEVELTEEFFILAEEKRLAALRPQRAPLQIRRGNNDDDNDETLTRPFDTTWPCEPSSSLPHTFVDTKHYEAAIGYRRLPPTPSDKPMKTIDAIREVQRRFTLRHELEQRAKRQQLEDDGSNDETNGSKRKRRRLSSNSAPLPPFQLTQDAVSNQKPTISRIRGIPIRLIRNPASATAEEFLRYERALEFVCSLRVTHEELFKNGYAHQEKKGGAQKRRDLSHTGTTCCHGSCDSRIYCALVCLKHYTEYRRIMDEITNK